MQPSIYRVEHSGALVVSTVVGSYRTGRTVTRTYYGYTRREALAAFRSELRNLAGCAR